MGADEERVDRAEKRDVAGDLGGEAPEVDEPGENPRPLRQ